MSNENNTVDRGSERKTLAALKAATLLMGARTRLGSYIDMITATQVLNDFNFIDDDYSRITGLEGDGSTTYLDTGRANNADPQISKHVCVYASRLHVDNGTEVDCYLGVYEGGATRATVLYTNSNQPAGTLRTRNNSETLINTPGAHAVGFMGTSRSSSDNYTVRGGGSSALVEDTSTDPTANNLWAFAANNVQFPQSPLYGTGRLTFYSIGEAVDLALLDQRVTRMVNLIQYYLYTGEDGAAYDTDTLIYVNNGYANGGGL